MKIYKDTSIQENSLALASYNYCAFFSESIENNHRGIHLHNNTVSRRRRTTTMRSNNTLVDTPFQLVSGFFHVNQGVLCCEHAEQASSRGCVGGGATGLLNKGGGSNRLPALVTKQQAVEFPQVLTS